ncbi:MAG: hypothetical protein J6T72_03660, partial [Alphaproteobacteria bacterium]|nr:hypothetical protein [Alphaproteobacteria bacterium]
MFWANGNFWVNENNIRILKNKVSGHPERAEDVLDTLKEAADAGVTGKLPSKKAFELLADILTLKPELADRMLDEFQDYYPLDNLDTGGKLETLNFLNKV